jgi:mannose-6-phosphate isomerase
MPFESLTPLRFAPQFKTAIWGGNRLRALFGAPPSAEPTGEAWILSDHGDDPSVIMGGALAGTSLRQLLAHSPERILGQAKLVNGRFPILLKFIHAREPLSVQVHPSDAKARELEGPTASGKTEAWIVLEADPTARMYSGLQSGVTPEQLRQAIADGNVDELLYIHAPSASDCLFLPAGAVHSIGGGLVLFEIQQTSDLTYRLYDWQRVDPKTGKSRELHVEKGLASVDYTIGPCRPAYPTDEGHGRVRPAKLVDCNYFTLGRWDTDKPFRAGAAGKCRVLVGIAGKAALRHAGKEYPIGLGGVWLLPAEVGACECVPKGPVVILECGLVG